MTMERVFGGASFLSFVAAVGLWWTNHHSTMFVVATVGALFWALSIRVRMRRIIAAADAERLAEQEEEEFEDD
jgi:hypothetical protein